MIRLESIKDQLLKRCVEAFNEISQTEVDDFYGTQPRVFYIGYGKEEKRFIL